MKRSVLAFFAPVGHGNNTLPVNGNATASTLAGLRLEFCIPAGSQEGLLAN